MDIIIPLVVGLLALGGWLWYRKFKAASVDAMLHGPDADLVYVKEYPRERLTDLRPADYDATAKIALDRLNEEIPLDELPLDVNKWVPGKRYSAGTPVKKPAPPATIRVKPKPKAKPATKRKTNRPPKAKPCKAT